MRATMSIPKEIMAIKAWYVTYIGVTPFCENLGAKKFFTPGFAKALSMSGANRLFCVQQRLSLL